MLPPVAASKIAQCETVPHPAEAGPSVMAVPFDLLPPEAAGKFVELLVIAKRA